MNRITEDIKAGKYSLLIHEGTQGKHIIGHNNYIHGRSYLTISLAEAQELVYKYAGSGKPDGLNKEIVKTNRLIGVVIDENGGEYYTTVFKLHHSKKGAHIVPRKEF